MRGLHMTGAVLAICTLLQACFQSGSSSNDAPPPVIDGLVTPLTTGNPLGEDDDSTVALDAAGALHVVWFSDRDGTKDLYYVHSTSIDLESTTIAWSVPLQLTHLDSAQFPPPTQGDNYPSLVIDDDGMLDVAWHRWNLANECHVYFLSFDGTSTGLMTAVEVPVTSGPNFDRFPNVVRFGPNDLRIYFVSTTRGTPGVNEIFVAHSPDDGASWGTPVAVPALDAGGEHSTFPMILRLAPDAFVATLERWTLGATGGELDPTTDVFYAESADGETWTVDPVTHDVPDDFVDLTPALFLDHGGALQLAWATTALGDPAADLARVAISERALYPASAHTLSSAIGITDHSPRVIALNVEGRQVYAMIWVRIADGVHNQVVYRVFSEL